jgi:GNAT superfamily N-acetyltransferase
MDVDDLRIREYDQRDSDQVLELNETVLRDLGLFEGDGPDFADLEFADLHDVEEAYHRRGGTFLVGEIDDTIIAAGGFYPDTNVDMDTNTDTGTDTKGVAKLRRMRVAPELQGKGIGSRMLKALEEAAREKGFTALTLDTTVEQTSARRFYRTNGYRRTDRREFEGFDSVFFRKRFDGGE